MKNSNYIINGILAIAVIVLFILQFTGRKSSMNPSETLGFVTDSTGHHLPIAYIRTDSLLTNYKFFIDLNDAGIKKLEDKKLDINRRSEKLKKEILDYQQKAQMNAFISQDRQMQEQNRLAGLQQDFENYYAQAQQEIAVEQTKMNQQLQDTIVAALKLFNMPRKYELILSNTGTDNILYAGDSYDITKEVTDFLNARYEQLKK
ncbi:MAG: OmpH family outer membrane protein [Candidatus Azobacteroides sp.]|nr:OmpH family outer membrane protein [Candidatus Azobacteroides sp.]